MALSFPRPNVGFHVFIDEAGDFSVKSLSAAKGRFGTQWCTLGALVVSQANLQHIATWCNEIKQACGVPVEKPLHYRLLTHEMKILACQMLSKYSVRCFVFCSQKQNMRGHRNDRAAAVSNDKNWFHNSCIKYLLERVTDFGLQWTISQFGEPRHAEVCLAEHPYLSISNLKSYLEREMGNIRNGSAVHQARPLKWEVMNLGRFYASTPEQAPGLQLADLVASSFYSCLATSISSKMPSVSVPATSLRRVLWDGTLANNQDFGLADNGITVFPPYRPLVIPAEQDKFFGLFGLNLASVP